MAFDSSFDPNYFNELSIVDAKNGYIEITAATAQNFLTWFFFVSTSNFQVTAAWPLYKNFPIRWSGVHGADTMTDNTTTDATTQNLDPGGPCPYNGCGPYRFSVSAINGKPRWRAGSNGRRSVLVCGHANCRPGSIRLRLRANDVPRRTVRSGPVEL